MTNYTKDTLDMIPGETPREKHDNLKRILTENARASEAKEPNSWMYDKAGKTPLEWFKLAKEKGLPWADEAIEYYDGIEWVCHTLVQAIDAGLTWGKTPNGMKYWQQICESL